MEIKKILASDNRFYRTNEGKTTNNNSIELPERIQSLITGSDYWRRAKENRYKKLIRDGHLADLILLAETAESKRNPANWFAKAASKVQWERTLQFIAKLRKVVYNAAEVMKRITVPTNSMKAVYKACWKLNDTVVRYAVIANETGNNKFKYFNWLCNHHQYKLDR